MKTLLPLALLPLICLAGPATESAPPPLTTINFRGEELPVYAPPRPLNPKRSAAPRYPGKERAAGIEGQAVLVLLVGTDGKVAEVNIAASKPTAAFGEAAKAAVRQWRFEPQSRNGQPTKFIVQQAVNFTLSYATTTTKGSTMQIVPDRYPYYEGFGRTP